MENFLADVEPWLAAALMLMGAWVSVNRHKYLWMSAFLIIGGLAIHASNVDKRLAEKRMREAVKQATQGSGNPYIKANLNHENDGLFPLRICATARMYGVNYFISPGNARSESDDAYGSLDVPKPTREVLQDGCVNLGRKPLPRGEYYIEFSAKNGKFYQTLELKNVDGKLVQFIEVKDENGYIVYPVEPRN